MSSPLPVSHLRGRGCRFTIIPPAGHEYTTAAGKVIVYGGKQPQGKGWADEGGSNYAEADRKLQEAISKGWNHGLVCGAGGVVPFDADEGERLMELGVLGKIPPTIQVESREGHRHHHLLCPELTRKIVLFDPIWTKWALKKKPDPKPATPRKFKFERVRVHLGEVLGPGGHAVLPGSVHPSGSTYHLVEGCPQEMAEISLAQLKEILRGLEFSPDPDKHITFEAAVGIETPRGRLEEIEAEARKAKAKRADLSPLSDQLDVKRVLDVYSWKPTRIDGDEAKGIGPCHGSTNGDDFQINTKSGRWHCKRCNAGGDLASLVALFEGIISSCCDHGLLSRDLELFSQVVEACENRGLIPTREKAEPRQAAKLPDDLADRLKADPDLLEELEILEGLRSLRQTERLRFENLLKKASIRGGQREALAELLDRMDQEDEEEKDDQPEVSEEIALKARKILEEGDPIQARCDYVARRVRGNDGVAKAFIYSCSSAYMPTEDKLHADGVGASQGGKSVTAGAVHETYPPENVEILTEASPKSIYYFAKRCEAEGRSLDDTIIYINDAREEHIPVLKVFRDDGPGTPRNLTVSDGECVDLKVPGRPVVQSSSVLPLRDLDQQAVSRSFLATVTDTDDEGERKVRKKIRTGLEYGALLKAEDDTEKAILQQMGRILRDEGIRSIVVPFDPTEPKGADRRGTGQFIRLIKISAHENQFQRPILEMKDGSRHVLATYDDLKNAADLWFEFEEAQAFKINHKVLTVFKSLPTTEPDHYNYTERSPSTNHIAKDTGIGPRSVERYLDDLYDAGLIFRKKASAPGNPYIFWTTTELRQKVMSQISASDDAQADLRQITTKKGCRKYLGENCPDCLKSSLSSFFTNYDIISTENVKGILFRGDKNERETFVPGEKIISSIAFLQNRVVNTPIEAADSEYLRQGVLSESVLKDVTKPQDDDSLRQDDSVRKAWDSVVNVRKDDDDLSLQELLAREKERAAEDAERKKTPEPEPSEEEVPGPSLSLAGFKEIYQRLKLEEITAPILAKDQGINDVAAKVQLNRAEKAYGLIRRRVGFDDFYRLPEEAAT